MTETLHWTGWGLALAFLAGAGLAGLYLASLWVTVRSLAAKQQTWLWLAGGAVVRLGIVAGGFFLIMGGQWERLAACAAGFLLVRTAGVRWAARKRATPCP